MRLPWRSLTYQQVLKGSGWTGVDLRQPLSQAFADLVTALKNLAW